MSDTRRSFRIPVSPDGTSEMLISLTVSFFSLGEKQFTKSGKQIGLVRRTFFRSLHALRGATCYTRGRAQTSPQTLPLVPVFSRSVKAKDWTWRCSHVTSSWPGRLRDFSISQPPQAIPNVQSHI